MKIGIIGFGHLGRAFASGLLHTGCARPDELFVCAKSDETLQTAHTQFGAQASRDVNQALAFAEAVFFVVKEDAFFDLLQQIDKTLLAGKEAVSFMAALSLHDVQQALGPQVYVSKAIPSVAIADGTGITGYTKTRNKQIDGIYEKLGLAYELDEYGLKSLTALASCGLGFAAHILDCYQQAGQALGFDAETAARITARTFENACRAGDFAHTAAAVATKGGITERGIRYYQEQKLGALIRAGMMESYKKLK